MDKANICEQISESRACRLDALLTVKGLADGRRDSCSKQEHRHDKRLHVFGRLRERILQASN
jgi:hypothetical protein